MNDKRKLSLRGVRLGRRRSNPWGLLRFARNDIPCNLYKLLIAFAI